MVEKSGYWMPDENVLITSFFKKLRGEFAVNSVKGSFPYHFSV